MQSQQTPVVVVEKSAKSTPPFSSMEIERSIYDKLNDISINENISMKILVQRLLAHMLIYHKNEVTELTQRIRCKDAW